jgi:lipoprotein-anchoring transpeptidase ErfK/SrfK
VLRRSLLFVLLAACGARAPNAAPPRDLDAFHDQPHATPVPSASIAAPTSEPEPPPAPVIPAAPAESTSPDAATLAALGWPDDTQSFVVKISAHVFEQPDMTLEPLGKILAGTRLPVGASVAGDKRCKMFLAVPHGFICARYAKASKSQPEAVPQPVVADGELLPQTYFGIKKGAHRYATVEDVRAGIARPERSDVTSYMVTREDKLVDVDGVKYAQTTVGLVATTDLYRLTPSTFAGVDLVQSPPPAWPFAWVIAADKKTVTVRATPDKKGVAISTLEHRAIVPILEETGAYVRVGDGQWIDAKSVRIARKRTRPDVPDAHAKWIDVDRDQQVMIAYDGEVPVYATLISSGRRKTDTPPALYRIRSKSSLTKMAAEEREAAHYEVSEVPWATRFRSGLYFHAAYWHDRFGTPQSHGCVNLSPIDAKWVYDWTEPTMPPGWNELEVRIPGSMVVRVYDAAHEDPPAFDYAKEAIQRAKIRKQEEKLRKEREEREAAEDAAAHAIAPVVP